MRILLAEDDSTLARLLRDTLRGAGYAVDIAPDGIEADFLAREGLFDAVILDLGLPRRPGLDVLRDWRATGLDLPVLILTARDAWHEKIEGFRAGADDYLTKPFHAEELLARLSALLRRARGQAPGPLSVGRWRLDEASQEIRPADGPPVALTHFEYRLLRLFLLHPDRVLSRAWLEERLYDESHEGGSNVLEVLVNRLRGKLGRETIQTRRGQGYLFASGAGQP
ncbi:MAG: response regulator transcription factor [Halothiobacillaceae bacterium]|nr:MAG: response regulator transcription factor [Halothiobacillaceae bacterium]